MNNNGDDQTVRMYRLVCTFVVRKPPKGFLATRPKYIGDNDDCDDLNVDDHVNENEKYDTDYNDVGDHGVNDTDEYHANEKQ